MLNRRQFVSGLALAAPAAALASGITAGRPGRSFDLSIGYQPVNCTGRARTATAINGGVPGPVLHWREGDEVAIRVHNQLAEMSSIHWHGIILPTGMDGVPGMSFDGIAPGEFFDYRFRLNQSGSYWYHSHSGWQEQTGTYGAIVVHPRDGDPDGVDRDHVVLLSDWTDEDPAAIYRKLAVARRTDAVNRARSLGLI